jgi:hypothetical protein
MIIVGRVALFDPTDVAIELSGFAKLNPIYMLDELDVATDIPVLRVISLLFAITSSVISTELTGSDTGYEIFTNSAARSKCSQL